MTEQDCKYDCAVVGGGVAGLCLAIQLARLQRKVIVFEKHSYPFHKVCGEYVSNESAGFFLRLGLKLEEWDLPQISRLGISSEEGFVMRAPLGIGGFGLSRFRLDEELARIARSAGVTVMEATRVHGVSGGTVTTSQGIFQAVLVVGAFGKTNPVFAAKEAASANNYVGVKYHVRLRRDVRDIELHNFRKGYCGISRIEDDRYCLCYISHSSNLAASDNSIALMEERVLARNPHLSDIFSKAEHLFERPVVVSNIRFSERTTSNDQLLFVGDAAGCISPLTGNGMSMAGYGSILLAGLLQRHFSGDLSFDELRESYAAGWSSAFSRRIRRGRQLQQLFGRPYLSDIALRVLSPMSGIKARLVEATHGVPF